MDRRSLFGKSIFEFGGLVKRAFEEKRREEADAAGLPPKLFRPPGALAEKDFLDKCTHCNDCIEACPHGVVFKHFESHSPDNLTPTLSPGVMPCRMCEDVPCAKACTTGALVVPPDRKAMTIGKAEILIDTCLAWNGAECTVCLETCPETPKALVLDSENHMRVRESLCTGCGMCEQNCPRGSFAIRIVPLRKEPAPKA